MSCTFETTFKELDASSKTLRLSTQSRLAGNFPHYLAGSWNFAHDHPGSAEHLFFPSNIEKRKKMFYWRFFVLLLPIILHFANNFRWVPLDIDLRR